MDPGTKCSKASLLQWYLHGERPRPGATVESVVWPPNQETEMPSRIAITARRIFYGCEVDDGLKNGTIQPSQVIENLKSYLLDPDANQPLDPEIEANISFTQISEMEAALRHYGQDPARHTSYRAALYAGFIGYLYRLILWFIARRFGSLRWPVSQDLNFYRGWTPPGSPNIYVALAIPAATTQSQVTLLMAAARVAGIPNVYPVAEPACALIRYLFRETESRRQDLVGNSFCIIDAGAGTADQQRWVLKSLNPMRLKQVVIPPDSRTSWCGGSYINDTMVGKVMNRLHDRDGVLRYLRDRDHSHDERWLRNRIAKEVEKLKRRFSGNEDLLLEIPELADIPSSIMPSGGIIILASGDVRAAFLQCLRQVIRMTESAVAYCARIDGAQSQPNKIVITGGCFQNEFLSWEYRKHFGPNGRFGFIPVEFPSEDAKVSLSVAHGAVMLSTEKDLIQQRHVDRSYYIGRHEEVDGRPFPPDSVYRHAADGVERVYVTKLLLKKGLYPQRLTRTVSGFRALLLDELESDGTWLIQETIYYSDTLEQDGLWIEAEDIDLHAMEDVLEFRIAERDLEGFTKHRGVHGRVWYYLDYDIQLRLDGEIMTAVFFVPRKGKWPQRGENRYANAMEAPASWSYAGAVRLYN